MINKKIQDALNTQITLEQYSAQLYLAMSAHCEGRSFRGFAHWLRVQAQEETKHAMKLVSFLLDRGGKLELGDVSAPPSDFGTVTHVFEKILEHEKSITGRWRRSLDLARRRRARSRAKWRPPCGPGGRPGRGVGSSRRSSTAWRAPSSTRTLRGPQVGDSGDPDRRVRGEAPPHRSARPNRCHPARDIDPDCSQSVGVRMNTALAYVHAQADPQCGREGRCTGQPLRGSPRHLCLADVR